MAMLNLMTGVWLWKEFSLPVRAIITLTLITSVAFGPRWDGTRGFLSSEAEKPKKKKKAKALSTDRGGEATLRTLVGRA
ncbi:unnamed protein product [Symbiodinium sp. CCMP2456]|nr:unnamed protein product [Symbiodinium sp. CCMP2456]